MTPKRVHWWRGYRQILCDCWYYKASINLECILSKGMFKWGNTRTEIGQKELEGQREELTERINLLEAKRRDAQAQYERLTRENRPLQTRRTALLQVKSFDRRIETAANLQLKLDRNLEALEAATMAQTVLGSLNHSSTKVLQKLPGKEGAALSMLDDNEIALEETGELVNALSGAHEAPDDELEAMLQADLARATGTCINTAFTDEHTPMFSDKTVYRSGQVSCTHPNSSTTHTLIFDTLPL